MENDRERKMVLLMGLILFILLVGLPVGILFFGLPWYSSFNFYITALGAILIIIGISLNYIAINNLKGKYSDTAHEKIDVLVISGIYSYTRNPMYLGQAMIIIGLYLVFPLTLFLIVVFLFIFSLYTRAKKEEKELSQKFGEKYMAYSKEVSFMVPNPFKRIKSSK